MFTLSTRTKQFLRLASYALGAVAISANFYLAEIETQKQAEEELLDDAVRHLQAKVGGAFAHWEMTRKVIDFAIILLDNPEEGLASLGKHQIDTARTSLAILSQKRLRPLADYFYGSDETGNNRDPLRPNLLIAIAERGKPSRKEDVVITYRSPGIKWANPVGTSPTQPAFEGLRSIVEGYKPVHGVVPVPMLDGSVQPILLRAELFDSGNTSSGGPNVFIVMGKPLQEVLGSLLIDKHLEDRFHVTWLVRNRCITVTNAAGQIVEGECGVLRQTQSPIDKLSLIPGDLNQRFWEFNPELSAIVTLRSQITDVFGNRGVREIALVSFILMLLAVLADILITSKLNANEALISSTHGDLVEANRLALRSYQNLRSISSDLSEVTQSESNNQEGHSFKSVATRLQSALDQQTPAALALLSKFSSSETQFSLREVIQTMHTQAMTVFESADDLIIELSGCEVNDQFRTPAKVLPGPCVAAVLGICANFSVDDQVAIAIEYLPGEKTGTLTFRANYRGVNVANHLARSVATASEDVDNFDAFEAHLSVLAILGTSANVSLETTTVGENSQQISLMLPVTQLT